MDNLNIDHHKLMYHPELVAKWLNGMDTYPIMLEVGLTDNCQHNCSFCLDGNTLITMSDFSEKKIKNVRLDDMILGFDEISPKTGRDKKVYPSKVLNIFSRKENVIKITFNDNTHLLVTKNHKILANRGHNKHSWRNAGKYKIGQDVASFPYKIKKIENINLNEDLYKKGYIVGMFLGDGYISSSEKNKHGNKKRFRLALTDIEPLNRIANYFEYFHIDFYWGVFDIHLNGNKKPAIYGSKYNAYDNLVDLIVDTFNSNNYDYYRGFLAGIYDAEGHIDKKSRTIRISNTNKFIIDEICRCLDGINIPYIIEFNKRKTNIKDVYNVRILAKKQFYNLGFIDIIDPAIIRKGITNFHNIRMRTTKVITNIEEIKDKIDVYNIETESKTYIANNTYVHNCSLNWITHSKNYLETDVLCNRIFEMTVLGLKSVYAAGEGEPLLHPDVEYIIKYCHALKLRTSLATNGQLLDEHTSAEILPCLSWIRISLDAAKDETHSKIHGVSKKCFPLIVDNIAKAVGIKKRNNLDVNIGIQALLLSENINEIEDIVILAKMLEVDNLQIKPAHNHPKSKFNPNIYKFSYEGLQEELKKYNSDKFKVIVRSKTMEELSEARCYSDCYGPDFYALLSAKGDFVPCNIYYNKEEFIFGNIYEEGFIEIWDSPRRKEIMKKVAEMEHKQCGIYKCRQHMLNEYLWRIKNPELNDVFI